MSHSDGCDWFPTVDPPKLREQPGSGERGSPWVGRGGAFDIGVKDEEDGSIVNGWEKEDLQE